MFFRSRPKYLHDCESCIFLGRYDHEDHTYDLYVCSQGCNWPTIISRSSSDAPDYMSGLPLALGLHVAGMDSHPLVEAVRRAKDFGHLTKKETAI